MVIAMKYLAFRNRCSWLSVTSCVQVAILCYSFFLKHRITIIRPLAQRMINSSPNNASNSFDPTIFLANQKLSIVTCVVCSLILKCFTYMFKWYHLNQFVKTCISEVPISYFLGNKNGSVCFKYAHVNVESMKSWIFLHTIEMISIGGHFLFCMSNALKVVIFRLAPPGSRLPLSWLRQGEKQVLCQKLIQFACIH